MIEHPQRQTWRGLQPDQNAEITHTNPRRAVRIILPAIAWPPLLVTGAVPGAVSRMMQALGRRYVRYVNTRYRRTGTLWEGCFKSCLVDSDRYLLTCYRYVEFNPLRARMVAAPDEYRWSSHRHNALAIVDEMITPHPVYSALGATTSDRAANYRSLCKESITEEELAAIRAHLEQERAPGSRGFQLEIESNLGRCVHLRGSGKPRKNELTDASVL